MGNIDVKLLAAADINIVLKSAANVNIALKSAANIGINLPSDLAAPSYNAEYQTVYDSFTNKPTNPDDTRQDAWVESEVNDGVWDTQKDIYYNFAIHTNDDGEAQTNWLNPGTHDCTLVNAPAFGAFEGFTGDGTSYIDTNWNPNANGILFTLTNNSFAIYIRTNVNEARVDCGVQATRSTLIYTRLANLFRVYNNSLGLGQVANLDSRGHFRSNRLSAVEHDGYKNGSKVFDDTDTAFTPIPNHNFGILCVIRNGAAEQFSTKQVSNFDAGASMSDPEIANDTNNFETYMDAYGKGVIP